MTFSDLGLSPETLKAVEEVGYTTPTPIQEQAIPWVLSGRDVLGIAQTGTGKTAGFTLPMIDILAAGRAKARMPRSLILAPTRELANQVSENFRLYGKYHRLTMALLIGGESFTEQEKALARGVDVLIATPGRLIDLFERGRILLRDVKILVIDEADRMLDMGFIPDVERIVSLLPPTRQTLFFSATMDASIRKLADAFLHNPKEITVSPKTRAAETVVQNLVTVRPADKREALRHILRMEDVRNAFIFCNRKRDVGVLYRSLVKHGFDAVQLHGDMPQNERTATLARFKAGEAKLMVCSDVAARGIDIADVSHVFNFDVPTHAEDYIHRIGRTGRAGREGRAFTIATPEDARYVSAIEKLIGRAIPRIELEGLGAPEFSEGRGDRDRRGKRTGQRGRGRGRDRTTPAEPSKGVPSEAAEAVEQAADQSAEQQPQAAEEKAEQRDGRKDRRTKDKERRGRRSRDPAWTDVEEMPHGDDVVAFGEHPPAFLFAPMSGSEARTTTGKTGKTKSRKTAPAKTQAPAETVTEATSAPETAAPEADEKPKKRTATRRKKAETATEEATGTVAAPTGEAETPAEEAEAPTAEEKPKRRRTPRKKTAQAAAGGTAAETAKKPARRRKKAETAVAGDGAAPAPDADAGTQPDVPAEHSVTDT